MSALEKILLWDKELFIAIHDGWSTSFLDTIMPYFRNPVFWIPVYLFLLYFCVKKYGLQGLLWILAMLVVFGITDFTSASIFKPYFGRLRPCNEPSLQEFIHNLVSCGSGKSFPSSHSSNHFGISLFIIFTLGRTFKWMNWPAMIWAVIVVIAQVYVGVHYPLDIVGGLLVGAFGAGLVSVILNKYAPLE